MDAHAYVNATHARIDELIRNRYGSCGVRMALGRRLEEVGFRIEPTLLGALNHWTATRNKVVHAGRLDLVTDEFRRLGPALIAALETDPILHGRTVVIENKLRCRVLDVDHFGQDEGVGVNQWRNEGTENQRWNVYRQPDGSFALFAKHSGKSLSVADWSWDNGIRMVQWTWGGAPNQKWWLTPLDDGTFRVVSAYSAKALDGTWDEGEWAPLTQWDWHGADNQRWWIRPVD